MNNGNMAVAKDGNSKETDLPPRDFEGSGNKGFGLMLFMAIAIILLAMMYMTTST